MKLLVISIYLFSVSAFANANCGNSKRNTLAFANGMFNERAEANHSLFKLYYKYLKKYNDRKIKQLYLAYNTNEFVLLQLFQVYQQKRANLENSFWKSISSIYSELDIVEKFELDSSIWHDKDSIKQVKDYEEILADDFNIVTVAHSQGNFYTLNAFSQLKQKNKSEKVKMISVATPAGHVFGDGPYFTFYTDKIINPIFGRLDPNIKKASPGRFDHEFVNDYLGDKSTNDKILDTVRSTINNFQMGERETLFTSDGYLNSDMSETLHWFREYLKSKRQLSFDECLKVESLFSLYWLFNESCEGRNYNAFLRRYNACYEISDRYVGSICPYDFGFADDAGDMHRLHYPLESILHYEINPHCKMNYSQLQKKLKSQR